MARCGAHGGLDLGRVNAPRLACMRPESLTSTFFSVVEEPLVINPLTSITHEEKVTKVTPDYFYEVAVRINNRQQVLSLESEEKTCQ